MKRAMRTRSTPSRLTKSQGDSNHDAPTHSPRPTTDARRGREVSRGPGTGRGGAARPDRPAPRTYGGARGAGNIAPATEGRTRRAGPEPGRPDPPDRHGSLGPLEAREWAAP